MLSIGDFARLGQVSPRMLRHYDQLGLLRPDRVDEATSYRSYGVGQLARLHKMLALRDLGFGLEQLRDLLEDEPPVEQLRGMLRLRQLEIEQMLEEENGRLRRVEAHLRALEANGSACARNIVIKHTQPVRVAAATGTAPALRPETVTPVTLRLIGEVLEHLARTGAQAGILIVHFEEPADSGSVVVHAGFDIGAQDVASGGGVQIADLPVTQVASLMYTGPINAVQPVYEALIRWIDDSGYRLAEYSRELYHEFHHDDPARCVTELQIPIRR